MYRISRHIIIEEIEDGLVLFDPKKLLFYNLNETAARIFKLLKKRKKLSEIIQTIAVEFNASSEIIKGDVTKTFLDLEKKGVIHKMK